MPAVIHAEQVTEAGGETALLPNTSITGSRTAPDSPGCYLPSGKPAGETAVSKSR